MHAMQWYTAIFWVLMLGSIVHQSIGLIPSPRISDSNAKYQLQVPSLKQDKQAISEQGISEKKYVTGEDSIPTSSSSNKSKYNSYDDSASDDDDYLSSADNDKQRITISEPYKSLIQTTTRFAVAQTKLTNYINVDTFMDLINDAGYMLSHPSTLSKVLRVTAIVLATLMSAIFLVPAAFWKQIEASWKNPSRLLEVEKFLPNGLNEMGIITLLNDKTDEMLARFGLNQAACRQQSVCQVGELLRCAFPKVSKPSIKFISEHFSRPRYRHNKYIGAFLSGFVDQNCDSIEVDSTKACLSSSIKSFSSCPQINKRPANFPTQQEQSRPKQEFQTIIAERA